MNEIGFDNTRYLEEQSAEILRRAERFQNKLYIEFGGKLAYDYHAARILPGFDPNVKLKLLQRLKDKMLSGDIGNLLLSAKGVGDLTVVTSVRNDIGADDLRKLGDLLVDRAENIVAVLASTQESKIVFLAVCGKKAVAKGVKAGDLIRSVTAVCGGKGGGKPESAMGGGTNLLKLDDALATVDDFVAEKLGVQGV